MSTSQQPTAPAPAPGHPRPLLSAGQLYVVRELMKSVAPQAGVWVFGSRATGRARPFSDLDLLVDAKPPLDWDQRAALQEGFDASELPFRVDVVEPSDLSEGVRLRIEGEKLAL
jgi:predicted nucleotidyltransferase